MPAGELLIEAIAGRLSVQVGLTAEDIHAELAGVVSRRAVRYALERLMDQGLAKRGQRSRRGCYWTAVVRPLGDHPYSAELQAKLSKFEPGK